jgi:hypothetical protein
MKSLNPMMFAVLVGLPLAAGPAVADGASSPATGANSPVSGTNVPATGAPPSPVVTTPAPAPVAIVGLGQPTSPNAPAKSSAVGSEGSGGGK